ncbi:MAG: hypothetical protein ACFFAS_07800 [Promethearchaeota archaeon]
MSIDYGSIMDKNLTLEEFTEKLEDLLRKNKIGIVERRKIIRQKQQEFTLSSILQYCLFRWDQFFL